MAGDYLFFRRMIAYLLTLPEDIADILIPQFLMVICLMFFSMLTFSNIVASISTFYLSKDLDLLISSPLPIRDIFLSRYLVTTVNSSWMLFIFGIPIFVALGQCSGAGFLYYLGLALTIVPFILIPAGIGILLTVLLMRFFPARKTYQFLTVVGLVFMGGLVMFFRFLQPEKFLGKKVPMEEIQRFLENLRIPSYGFLPSTWATRAMQYGTKGDYKTMFFWVAVAWVAVIALLLLNVMAVSRMYYKGWSIAYTGRSGIQARRRSRVYPLLESWMRFLSPPLRTIILKDIRVFWRDPSQWTQSFILGALVVVYIYNIRSLPMESVFLKNFISVMNIGLAGVVLAAVSVRFVFTSVSTEARSFWLIKSAPLDFSKYLWTKFFFYLFPLLALAETLIVASNLFLATDRFLMMISVVGIFFITVGLTGLGIGLGAIYPVFEHENIAELATSTGAVYYMLISLAYVGITVMFGVRPIWVYFSQKFLSRQVGGIDVYLCYFVIIALTAAITVIPIHFGSKALKEMEA